MKEQVLKLAGILLCRRGRRLLGEFDLSILHDFLFRSEGKEDWAIVYHIGWPRELAAGIVGGTISPTFSSRRAALGWLALHSRRSIDSLITGG